LFNFNGARGARGFLIDEEEYVL
jgi:hypothetical protein